MDREKLKATSCDLQIANAQTKEEYAADNALIPKNSSVIVRRIPAGGVKATSRTCVTAPKSHNILGTAFRSPAESGSGTSQAMKDSSAPMSLAQLIKTANLAEANASEDDKIKAMMIQSCQEYHHINSMKKHLPSYTCFSCGTPGHYRKDCPTNGDKNVESVPRIKKSTGIPRSFMMEVKDPNTKGAMMANDGKYVIPIINAEAYAKSEKHQKRRRERENEGFPSAELIESVRKPRKQITVKDKEVAFFPTKDIINPAKAYQEKVATDCEKSPRMEPLVKKWKESG